MKKEKFLLEFNEYGMDVLEDILQEIIDERGINPKKSGYSRIIDGVSVDSKFPLSAKLKYEGTRDDFKTLISRCVDETYVEGHTYINLNVDSDCVNLLRMVFPFRININYDMHFMQSYIAVDTMRESIKL